EGDARDVLQEVFLSLLDRPEQFAGKSSLSTWLYSATTHLCLNRIRSDKTRSRLTAEQDRAVLGPSPPAPADRVAELRDLLARLPPDLALVAVYYFGDEMTHDEIAEVVGCSRRRVGHLVERLARIMAVVTNGGGP
ncbi:MAG TPA: sigma-70 family RNA polymerase sigma factor, partial [Gaiellaceae bacterium]|nr:sigma-70 family RNA polymerase sigma factor [Gaiellaceae bacterium]